MSKKNVPYIPHTGEDRARMLKEVGADSVLDLFRDVPPQLLEPPIDVPAAHSEIELMGRLREMSGKNANADEYASFLGAGAYNHYIPSVVAHVTGRSEFYTAYTPYQPEVSQGTLQAIYEYQSLMCLLTGMEVSNASMYDGASALSEAVLMSVSVTQRRKAVVVGTIHPEYLAVLCSYTQGLDVEFITVPEVPGKGTVDVDRLAKEVDGSVACVVVQQPNFFGGLEDVERLGQIAHQAGALLVVSFYPISLGLINTPAECGADIAVAEGQPLGNPLNFGGPYLGVFTCRKDYVRHMPGRIVGGTVDQDGKRAYVLTLQTREQHIRREKATSNICTNQALNALAATVYLSALGTKGLQEVAELSYHRAHYAAQKIAALAGFSLPFSYEFFNEFVVKCPAPVKDINKKLLEKNIIGGYDLGKVRADLANHMLVAVTEMNTREQIDSLVAALGGFAR